jgi:hypothetical protein
VVRYIGDHPLVELAEVGDHTFGDALSHNLRQEPHGSRLRESGYLNDSTSSALLVLGATGAMSMPTRGGRPPSSAGAIRPASGNDAAALSALALRSKAAWGYDAAFMAACRAELTITAEGIAARPTWVLEEQGAILGFYQLRIDGRMAEVAQFFVAPAACGAAAGGVCGRISRRRRAPPAAPGSRSTRTPHAEGFYRAMGMVPRGAAPSGSIPGRLLPQLRKTL